MSDDLHIEIDDRKLRALMKRLAGAEHNIVNVGILQSGGASRRHAGGASIVEIAASHEFGAPAAGIPERSFIRRTLASVPHAKARAFPLAPDRNYQVSSSILAYLSKCVGL